MSNDPRSADSFDFLDIPLGVVPAQCRRCGEQFHANRSGVTYSIDYGFWQYHPECYRALQAERREQRIREMET